MKGVYIITNPAYGDDLPKIGYSDDIDKRIDEFNRSTGVLYPFVKRAVYETENRLTDLNIHNMIDRLNPSLRVTKNKEFFSINYLDLIEWIKNLCHLTNSLDKLHIYSESAEDITNEESADKAFRRSPFKFSMVGLKEGDEVIFIRDNNIKATVLADDKHVMYEGNTYSISALAQILLGVNTVVSGTDMFSIDGHTSLFQERMHRENNTQE